MKIAIFASGNGSNFEALVKAYQQGELKATPVVCICDKAGAGVIERARRLGVEIVVVEPKRHADKAAYERAIIDVLRDRDVDLICLAGYMRIIGPTLLEAYEGRIINIHPSLLPAFKGAHAIQDAFDYGVKVFGVTIHYVDETLDGGRIISQVAVPYEGDDIEELERMIHRAEHRLYVDTVNRMVNA